MPAAKKINWPSNITKLYFIKNAMLIKLLPT